MAYSSKNERRLVPSSLRKWAGYVKSNGAINLNLAIIADIVMLCTLHLEDEWWILLVVLFGGILLWGINLLVATVLAATAEIAEAAYNFNEREYKTRKEQTKQNEATQKNQQDEAHKAQLEARNAQIEKLNLPTAENPQKPEPAPQKPATPPQKPAEIRMQWGENIPKKKAAVPKYVFKGTQATCPFCHNIMEISDSAKSRGQAFCDECCKSFNLTKDVETTAEQIEEAKKKAQQQQEAKAAEEKRLQEEKEQKEKQQAKLEQQQKEILEYNYTKDEAICPFCKTRVSVSKTAKESKRSFCPECSKSFSLSKDCEPKDT